MVKTVNDITINDFDLVETTGSIAHLRKWYNLFPVGWFEKSIVETLNKAVELFSSDQDQVLEDKQWEAESFILIDRIRLNYFGVVNILGHRVKINLFKKYMRKFTRRKLKDVKDSNLAIYLNNLEELTGIKVKELKDLDVILKDLEFKQDKFHENHQKPKTDKSKKATPFIITVLRIHLYLGLVFNENLKLVRYVKYHEMALGKYAKQSNG